MKLIYYLIFIFWFTNRSDSQKFPQEQFPFPPQFKSPNAPNGLFGSDKSIYLPPESHTAMPMYSMNNGNKLPFHFLPPTATKAPSMYPTPFPMMISSSMIIPRRDEEDNESEQEEKPQIQPYPTSSFRNKNDSKTDTNRDFNSEKEMRPIPKNFNYQHPIDRIDIKFAPQMHTVTPKTPINQTPASQRRMIISSEILKHEQGPDQIRRASLLASQLNSSPITYYSTTEPAIPILRLSNEMDLDGSFSYEALGADQTHYVQHSRMENSGTDKEEQVVEGSYSYVGDNGQTYTVHYVADSNGYRATGEHLPVPPPIPEIIQRAVQYNLAEEAKRPQQLKSWQDNEKDYDHNENEKHRFSILPPRNLFTGRTPEAFSFGLTQASLLQNKIGTDDSSQAATKTNFDFSTDQSNKGKITNGQIAPQITFLASQGAHKPSLNTGHQQPQRVFGNEKPNLPQLMNYEAGSSETDQDNNKALWRWQYGLNANGAANNQHPNKNSISRSFGEGDDVIINFNNMSPEQYTDMIKGGFLEHSTEFPINEAQFKNNEPVNTESSPFINFATSGNNYIITTEANEHINEQDGYKNEDNTSSSSSEHSLTGTESIMPYTDSDWSKHMKDVQNKDKFTYSNSNHVTDTSIPKQSYEYSDGPPESVNMKAQNYYATTVSPANYLNENYNRKTDENISPKLLGRETKTVTTFSSVDDILNHESNIKFTDFIKTEEKNNFKPIINIKYEKETTQETTTTEASPESIIKENYFLKSLFKSDHEDLNRHTKVTEEPERQHSNKINLEPKFDKVPKLIQYQSKPLNEVKNVVKKPIDIADVLNYITLKNHFESNKLRAKNKFANSAASNHRYERPQTFIPLENNRYEEEEQLDQEESQNNLRVLNNQKQQELRGIIKNYKVLQRNGNTKSIGLNKDQVMTDSSRLKTFQTQSLPPLGRAGPSMKSYLPPTYL